MGDVPDALGDEGREAILAQQLAKLQQQIFSLEVIQVANDAADADLAPMNGAPPISYGERRQQIEAAIKRLTEKYPDLAAQVTVKLSE